MANNHVLRNPKPDTIKDALRQMYAGALSCVELGTKDGNIIKISSARAPLAGNRRAPLYVELPDHLGQIQLFAERPSITSPEMAKLLSELCPQGKFDFKSATAALRARSETTQVPACA